MGEAVGLAFDEFGRAAVRIPEGFQGGDLVLFEIQAGRALVRVEVLEGLVRAYHELDEGPRDPETNEPITEHVECACGWCGKAKDRGRRWATRGTTQRWRTRSGTSGG